MIRDRMGIILDLFIQNILCHANLPEIISKYLEVKHNVGIKRTHRSIKMFSVLCAMRIIFF